MKKIIIGVFVLGLLLVNTSSVLAKTETGEVSKARQQLVLLQEINRLLLEVQRLQSILKTRSVSVPKVPYKSVFFDRPYEAIYFVDGTGLKPATGSNLIRPIDQELFDLLKYLIGEEVVRDKIGEWRVFRADEEDLGGFVELIAGTEDWVFGVNRALYDKTSDLESVRSFTDLFMHEYAHLLIFSKPKFTQDFTEKFWSNQDMAHKAIVEKVSSDERFDVLAKYYDTNPNRFVSDYSTLSPDEDLAETFVAFVREEKGTGETIRSAKINTFYTIPEFVLVRSTLRTNLKNLGVLN